MKHGRGLRITCVSLERGPIHSEVVPTCTCRINSLSADSQGTEDKARAVPFHLFQCGFVGCFGDGDRNQSLVNFLLGGW